VDVVFRDVQPPGLVFGRTYRATLEVPSNARNFPVKAVPFTASFGILSPFPRP